MRSVLGHTGSHPDLNAGNSREGLTGLKSGGQVTGRGWEGIADIEKGVAGGGGEGLATRQGRAGALVGRMQS